MDTKFQTSFIPKKTTIETPGVYGSKQVSINIFSVIANIVFVLALIGLGGGYFYKNILINQVKEKGKELESARASFEVEKVQDLVDVSNRFTATKKLLENHVAVSEFLVLLQNSTLKSVRFTDLSYQNLNNAISIKMDSEAQSFNAIAQQTEIFSKIESIKEPLFTDFLLSENGNIKLKFTASITPGLVSYKKFIESVRSNQ
ncbi:MAG: hypothetical protein ABL917_03280 [Parcubacteria group bacterium]